MSKKEPRKERLLVGDLVEVESCDDGFEGCFCEVRMVTVMMGWLGGWEGWRSLRPPPRLHLRPRLCVLCPVLLLFLSSCSSCSACSTTRR
eukprot:COSAG02_NODE_60_length_43475_cov_59.494582_25_plen_90_part_00